MTEEEQYVDGLFEKDKVLEKVRAGMIENGMPDIAVADGYGRLLTMLVKLSQAEHVLEIGALGGYSGVCLTRGLKPTGKLVSLELVEKYAEIAHKHMTEAGFGGQVEYWIGDAKESLEKLYQSGAKFQFFFIDADKEGYPIYLDYALKMADPGAVIVADNILLRGRTINLAKQGPAVQAVRRFNEQMANDPRLESTIIPGYDGLAIARVK